MSPNDTLAVKATETGHVDLFWRQYLPNGRDIPCDVAHSITGGWVHAVQSLYRSEDSVLRGILLALALATKGYWEDMPSARELGLRLYNDALVEASTVFQLPKRAKSNSFLAAVRLFTLYEVCLYSRSDKGIVAKLCKSSLIMGRNSTQEAQSAQVLVPWCKLTIG
jgi:hypothetical protein